MEVTEKDIKKVILTVDIEEDIKELEERIIEEPNNQKLKNELQELKKLLIKLQGLEQQSSESEGNVVDKIESEKPKGILGKLNPNNIGSAIVRKLTNFKEDIFNKISGTSDLEKGFIDDEWNTWGHSIEQEQKLKNTLKKFLLNYMKGQIILDWIVMLLIK